MTSHLQRDIVLGVVEGGNGGRFRGRLKEFSTDNDGWRDVQCIVFNANLTAAQRLKSLNFALGFIFFYNTILVIENW